ncbi:MAG: serine hydrolase [Steroidobacteraceae bacterium]
MQALVIVAVASLACVAAPPGAARAATPAAGAPEATRALSRERLLSGTRLPEPVSMAEFAPPATAAPPRHAFNGRLVLSRTAQRGDMRVLRDDYRTTLDTPGSVRHLPSFDFEFVTSGDALIPVARGPQRSRHALWEYVLEPGRLWSEAGDGGMTRASLPFALMERNANCVHNGVLTFLFDDTGRASNAVYEIASETCPYLKVDLWGVVASHYRPGPVAARDTVVGQYAREVAARLPTRPISALAHDFPGARPRHFGSSAEVAAGDLTAFGFVIDGIHYTGGCDTRHGIYPFCDVLDMPSYSLAKSLVAGLGTMHLSRRFPRLLAERIADYVPSCRGAGSWQDVTFGNALDMATGHYDSPVYDEDEKSAAMLQFFVAADHEAKIRFACRQFPLRAPPGTRWVYHTIDTYILGTALSAFWRRQQGEDADFYRDVLVRSLWEPLSPSPVLATTRRTRDPAAQPFTGYGLLLHRDDIARVGALLVSPEPRLDGTPLFDPAQFARAMQRNPDDRGLTAIDAHFRYANGFWAHDVSPYLGCTQPTWVPYMAGFGGITVLLIPNGTVYYYVSDGGAFQWRLAAEESHRIRPYCSEGAPSARTGASAGADG